VASKKRIEQTVIRLIAGSMVLPPVTNTVGKNRSDIGCGKRMGDRYRQAIHASHSVN
jgi:hypothetical protein